MATRRNVMAAAGGAALVLGLSDTGAMAQTTERKTFVLIHGAYHGGWCWRRVADLLEARGHKVYAPSLTGLADRSHLMSRDINLDTHIQDVVNLFTWEDLRDVTLVAHSYGGWPVTGALETIADRVSSLVYLDAFLPSDGQKGSDFLSTPIKAALAEAVARGDLSRPSPKAEFFKVNEKDRAYVDSKTTPQPNGIALQAIKLTGAYEKVARKAYIRAPAYTQAAFDAYFAEKNGKPGWKTMTVPYGHDIMIDAPAPLADMLLSLA